MISPRFIPTSLGTPIVCACGIIALQVSLPGQGIVDNQTPSLTISHPASDTGAVPEVSPSKATPTDRTATDDLPRFVINSPFSKDYQSPVPPEGKQLWATSRLWERAPDWVVEKWLTPEPERTGKVLLLEFWATWCSQCRRTIPKLNAFHHRFAEDLVIVGVSDEDEATIRSFDGPTIEYPLAIDTQARMKKALGVMGLPHVLVVEPGGYVVWEGFPLLQGHELTESVLAAIIEARPNRQAKPDPSRNTHP